MFKNLTEVRDAFWLTFFVEGKPREFYGKTAAQLPADLNAGFAEFVAYAVAGGSLSAALAQGASL